MVEISRDVERRYIFGCRGDEAAAEGGGEVVHFCLSREKWPAGLAFVVARVMGGCAGADCPRALAASSHFSLVLWSTGHLSSGSAPSGRMVAMFLSVICDRDGLDLFDDEFVPSQSGRPPRSPLRLA